MWRKKVQRRKIIEGVLGGWTVETEEKEGEMWGLAWVRG
jgi:hypothetical protein